MAPTSVLVVEDNRDEMLIYTTLLRHHGYAVFAAADFDSALRIAKEQRPDIAIVDIKLGDGQRDGCDLVDAFRQAAETRDMPVIAHTAFGDVYHRALETAGCATVVHKPSNPTDLLRAIERLAGPPLPG